MSRQDERLWAISVGSELCPECGEAPTEEHRPGRWERFNYWLVSGGEAPTTLICANGHDWVRSVGVVLFQGGSSVPKWVRIPRQVFRALLAERRMQPTPMTYLLASGIGISLGLILDLALGWTWWVVASVFVAVVWLYFLSSAFRGPDRDLGHRLLNIINPDRAAERNRQRLENALASGSLIGYEVESWEGDRSIGGWSGSPDPHSLTIRHGEHDEQERWVEVTTHAGDAVDNAGHWIQEELERRLVQAQFPLPLNPTIEDFQRRQRSIQQAAPPDWESTSFRVDRENLPWQIARVGSHWAAFMSPGRFLIEMTGNGVDPDQIQLVRIATLAPYPRGGA